MPHDHCLPRYRTRVLLFAALAIVASATAAQPAGDKRVAWKLSTAVGPAFALGRAGERWAKLIAERSGSADAVQLFPGATLAQRDPAREFVALRDGAADLAVGSTLFWSMQVSELTLIGLPWLAPEDKDLAALAGGAVAGQLAAAIERAGAVPLAFAPLGHRELATTGNVPRMPADLAGTNVRVASLPLVVDLFATLGARPRAMAFADAQAAFGAGTLDAQEGAPATFAAARLYALGIRNVVLWGAIAEMAVFAANRAAWEKWTDAERALVRDSAQQAARELPAAVRSDNDAALAELQKRGITVVRLTATGRAAFASAARGAYDKWATVAGSDLVQAAEAAVKERPP